MRWALAIVAVVAAVAPASALDPAIDPTTQVVPASLYFQIFDTVQEFHVTRSAPTVFGGEMPLPAPANVPLALETPHQLIGHYKSTPITENPYANGTPAVVGERGIWRDVRIADGPVVFHLYVRPDAVQNMADIPAALATPATTFRVRVMYGNQVGIETYGTDAILEAARTVHLVNAGPANTALNGTAAPDGNTILTPDADGVVDVAMAVDAKDVRIPRASGFHVRIDWQLAEAADVSSDAAVNRFSFVSDESHHPRMDFAVMQPVFIDYVLPQVSGGMLLIHVAAASIWGDGDLDLGTERLYVTGSVEKQLACEKDRIDSRVDHAPAQARICVWRFRDEGAPDGNYTLEYGISDVAGTMRVTATAGFRNMDEAYGIDDDGNVVVIVTGEESQESPGAGVAVVGALLLAAWRRRAR